MAGIGSQNADPVLIAALLSGATIVDSAERAGVSEQTARRRLRNPEFRARLNAAGDDLVAAAAWAIADANGEAVSALLDLVRQSPPAVRLGAVRTILEFTPRYRAAHEHEERLTLVERSIVDLREEWRKQR